MLKIAAPSWSSTVPPPAGLLPLEAAAATTCWGTDTNTAANLHAIPTTGAYVCGRCGAGSLCP